MGVVLMAWGPFNWRSSPPPDEELAHSAAARWEKHAIIGRRPAAQYLGPDEESVTLRGTIYPTATGSGSATTIGALLTAAQGSTTYTLMSADGTIVDIYRLERARAICPRSCRAARKRSSTTSIFTFTTMEPPEPGALGLRNRP